MHSPKNNRIFQNFKEVTTFIKEIFKDEANKFHVLLREKFLIFTFQFSKNEDIIDKPDTNFSSSLYIELKVE